MKTRVFLPIIIVSFTVALAFHFIALAAIDAPHNESSNINCGSCHGQGLLNSPFWGGSMSYDELCTNCHKVSSGPYTETNAPLVKTHSSANTSEQYGVWLWECRNCHDAHYQKQKNYKNTDAGNLYLATGTITNCVDNGNGTSTLTYSSISYKTGWDATKITEKTGQYRRTILFPNVGKLGYSYPVIAIDTPLANTITVSGDATPVYQYISSSTFAMMYGQYIKDSIESSQVKMVDRKWTSSFADGDVTYDGVCEICHTQTLYHQTDGSGTPHYPSVRCTTCHAHVDGFADSEHTGSTGADCESCHGHDDGWGGSNYYGTTISHSTHTENDSDDMKGPNIGCDDCHDTNNYPNFADGAATLAATTVCDSCHSPGGAYDGVDDAVIGAKNNWTDGVYASPTLKMGKELWCAGCHDDVPANSKKDDSGVDAPKVLGDDVTYGFYITGHGRNEIVGCLDCHDTSKKHIDHEHRTYEYDEGVGVVNPYCEGYRLRDVNGLPALRIPNPQGDARDYWRHYALCFDCHDRYKVLKWNISDFNQPHTSNFWDASMTWGNAHKHHVGSVGYDSDWDLEGDTKASCPTCHNVHGSPSHMMIRHGELISSPGTTDKVPGLDFAYVLPSPDTPDTATYTPDFSVAGDYGVYAWWTDHYTRAPNARYTINYNGGSETLEINQKNNGGQWNLLGTYNFAAGTGGSVVLSNEEAMGYVIADAIGFDTDGDSNPDVIIDNDEPEAQFVGPWWAESHGTQKYGADIMVSDMPEYPYDYNATLAESAGGVMRRGVQNINVNKICFTCHNSNDKTTYVRKPNVRPRVLIRQVAPSWVDNNGTDEVLLTAYVYSPKGNLTGVTIDLSSMDGSATQVMYDDGTHGDVTAGDNIYSYRTTVPPSSSSGFKILTVTGTDSDGLTGSRNLRLMVANPGWIVVDNQDVGAANCVGIWSLCNESEAYYDLRCNYIYKGSGGAKVTWTPTLTQAGNYNVYASWVESTSRATNAPYVINHSSGSDIVRVNQQESGREFVYLGTYYFDAQAGHTYVIVDNEDADLVGSWGRSTHNLTQYASSVHEHAAGTGANTATFTPDLPQAGNYEVYAWWTPYHNRATNAPYTINYSGGSDIVLINQEYDGGYWRYLGTYYFEAGTGGSVVLSDDANENVIADAVKFQLSANKQSVALRNDANNYVIADAILFEPVP